MIFLAFTIATIVLNATETNKFENQPDLDDTDKLQMNYARQNVEENERIHEETNPKTSSKRTEESDVVDKKTDDALNEFIRKAKQLRVENQEIITSHGGEQRSEIDRVDEEEETEEQTFDVAAHSDQQWGAVAHFFDFPFTIVRVEPTKQFADLGIEAGWEITRINGERLHAQDWEWNLEELQLYPVFKGGEECSITFKHKLNPTKLKDLRRRKWGPPAAMLLFIAIAFDFTSPFGLGGDALKLWLFISPSLIKNMRCERDFWKVRWNWFGQAPKKMVPVLRMVNLVGGSLTLLSLLTLLAFSFIFPALAPMSDSAGFTALCISVFAWLLMTSD